MRLPALVLVVLALAAGMTGLGLAVRGDEIAAANSQELQSLVQSVKTLLLNGKSASAISARKTGREVQLLLDQQAFNHAQVARGTRTIKRVILQIERHLDATILRDVNRAATRVQHAFGR
jgi:hypothetical protein